MKLDGGEVLKRAHERGLQPPSDCFLVDFFKNQFHAPANAECTVTLEVSNWLRPNWRYVTLTGVGRFNSSNKDSAVTRSSPVAASLCARSQSIRPPG